MHACVIACMHAGMRVGIACMNVRMNALTYAHIRYSAGAAATAAYNVCLCVRMCACVHVCTRTHVCVRACVCACVRQLLVWQL